MKSSEILYGKSDDEMYTKEYAVEPILKYIPEDWIVWCPFDKEESNFVKMISKTNKVIYSHIDTGQNFFEWEPEELQHHWRRTDGLCRFQCRPRCQCA